MAIRTPIKAIRAKCLDCCNDQIVEVRLCPVVKCPLHEYRMGHRPQKDTNKTNDLSTDNVTDEDFIEDDI